MVMGYQGGVAELVAGKLGGAYQVCWMLGGLLCVHTRRLFETLTRACMHSL